MLWIKLMLAPVVLRKFSRNDSLIAIQLTRGMPFNSCRNSARRALLSVRFAPVTTSPSSRKRFSAPHARQLLEKMHHVRAARLDQADTDVLPFQHVPLKTEDLFHAVPKGVGHDENAGRQRQSRDGEERLHRPPLDVAHGDAE